MKITEKIYRRFNDKDTLILVSSFPLLNEEIAKRNAVSRYSYLLTKHFPQNKKIVVICEQVSGKNNRPYLLEDNILVLPTYQLNQFKLFSQINQQLNRFDQVKDILLQFEFSLFGKEIITFLLPFFLLLQRLKGKRIQTMLHQVIMDLASLSDQVNLQQNSLKTKFFNLAMKNFYFLLAAANQKVLVHDQFLAKKLATIVQQEKIIIIPHGINSNKKFSQNKIKQIRKKWGLTTQDQVVLAYGYHSWYKGTDFVAKNFLKMKAAGQLPKNTKLVLAGDIAPTQKDQAHLQQYYQDLKKLINSSVDIIHTGFVAESEVPEIFVMADLLVYPYRARMSSSGAGALALQYQKPFICSEFFVENLLTEDSVLISEKLRLDVSELSFDLSYESFSETLLKVLNSNSLKKKISNFGASISSLRNWDVVSNLYLENIADSSGPDGFSFSSMFAKN